MTSSGRPAFGIQARRDDIDLDVDVDVDVYVCGNEGQPEAVGIRPRRRPPGFRFALLLTAGLLGQLGCAAEAPIDPVADCIDRAVRHQAPSQTQEAEIFAVCDEAQGLAVVFSAVNNGQAIAGLTAAQLRFTVARLSDSPAGPEWQSYINTIEQPGTGDWPGTTPEPQATTENNGTLASQGGNIMSYRFATNIRDVTSPIAVPYDPNATHRIGLEFRGSGLPTTNPTITYVPAGGTPVVTDSVATPACNECHAPLEAHGGPRTEVRYCVTCHNPGSADAQSGNSVDFKIMVHKIHRGADLPSVRAGGDYAIWGFQNAKSDFSTVVFPQDIRNCPKCHNPQFAPAADNWRQLPSTAACGSCHDLTAFQEPVPPGATLHPTGPVSDGQCPVCHTPTVIQEEHATLYATPHSPGKEAGVPTLEYQLLSASLTGNQPIVTLRVLADGVPVNLASPEAPLSYTSPGQRPLGPRLQIAWRLPEGEVTHPDDFNNFGQPLAQPAAVNLTTLISTLTANADGSFTTAAGALGQVPANATDVTIGMEGLFYLTVGESVEELGATSAVLGLAQNPPRRQIVDIAKCDRCHERLSAHGDNRADNIQICVLCHNPDATDRARRPASPAATPDGLVEQAIDFREMIHKIHTGEELVSKPYIIYGFATPTTGQPFDFSDVRFPGNRKNCLTCHDDSTFTVPIAPGALATTKLTDGDLASPLDDFNVSPTGAACTGCHDAPPTQAHAKVSFPFFTQQVHGTALDDCAVCHGTGTAFDVTTVHGVTVSP